MNPLYLASGSPRRRELLTQIGVPFTVISAPIDETPLPAKPRPMSSAWPGQGGGRFRPHRRPGVVLGADTAVVLDGEILGKPVDRDALAMLALSGREHQVLTAIALTDGQRCISRCVSSRAFSPPSPSKKPSATGPAASRGQGRWLCHPGLGRGVRRRLNGSYSAVVGLPVCETAELLANSAYPVGNRKRLKRVASHAHPSLKNLNESLP
jgi:septum formation protein